MSQSSLLAACIKYERAIELQPDNARLYFQLAACEWRLGRVHAGEHFQKAVGLDPKFAVANAALASWYLENGLVEPADQASRRAMEISPEDGSVMQSRAAVLEAMGELNAAWDLVLRLVNRGFVPMPLVRLYGRMARYQHHEQKALDLIEKQLKNSKLSVPDQALLHFAAADLLDSLGKYDEAFAHAWTANQLARTPYDPKSHERTFDIFIDYFTRQRLGSLPKGSDRSEKPVFIVGMPRSGGSLVEQILASHPSVHGAGELDFMSHVWAGTVQMLSARPEEYPSCLDRLTLEQVDGLAEIYLQPLIAMNPPALRITDKLPLNFLHLGLIALLLPGARIIDCRRDPRDNCLSCFMAAFEKGSDFKFDLNNTAHFYNQYRRLMRHWHESFDLPILEVSYEALVTDPENQTRRMLDFLGLPWDGRCLRFHENKRAVITSSMQQVRRPLYQSSIGRWRNYRRHFSELDRWFGPAPSHGS
ncbi:MAG: sulfotransferase [Tepidisphaeraceae bacterium]|jgi:tetratricopeptide (TPR) repeat protein